MKTKTEGWLVRQLCKSKIHTEQNAKRHDGRYTMTRRTF